MFGGLRSILLGLFFVGTCFAEDVLPPHCQPLPVKNETVHIDVSKTTVVVLHNIGTHDLWVTHVVDDPSASAGWSSRLQHNNWSALAVEKGVFDLTCIESKPGHEQQISCQDTLAVCTWSVPDFPSPDLKGVYWAAEDVSLSSLIAQLGRHGYKIPIEKLNE